MSTTTITGDTVVKGVLPDISKATFTQFLVDHGSPAAPVGDRVYDACCERGISPAFLLGLFWHESQLGLQGLATQTHSWGNTTTPAYGAPEQGLARTRFSIFADWYDGALGTIARLVEHPAYARARTITDIIVIWAPTSENDTLAYIAAVVATMTQLGAARHVLTPPRLLRVALAAGHHNTDGGNALEIVQTGSITQALAQALKDVGVDVRVITPDGPDADHEPGDGMFPGGLWDVARAVVALRDVQFWDPDVFVEVHTEGGGTTGLFVIYPDAPGDVDTDVRDSLGPALVGRLCGATGLAPRRAGKDQRPGIMSERETGVGAQGSRLGIFGQTADLKATCTRLIIEYGAHDKQPDLAIQQRPDFASVAGRATALALADWFGVDTANIDIQSPHVDPTLPPNYDPVTGYYIEPTIFGWYSFDDSGHPLGPAVLYSDGVVRQLFENVCIEVGPQGACRNASLGQAWLARTSTRLASWPGVTPLV